MFDAVPGGELGPAMPAPAGAEAADTISILKQMLDLAQQYLVVEEDEEDKLTMTKVLQQLQGYLAEEQKEKDGMLQGKMPARALRSGSATY